MCMLKQVSEIKYYDHGQNMIRHILIGLFLLSFAGPVQAAATAWKPFKLESGRGTLPYR